MNKNKQHNKIVPQLRFPEFLDDEEWEKKNLENACNMQAGDFISASKINKKNAKNLYPCYGGNGLRGYTKSFTHNGKHSLIGRQGALCGNITFAINKFHATEHAIVTTPQKNIDIKWLFYLLNNANLNQYATGQAQPGLSVTNLKKVKTLIPKNKIEQQKIANCLSSLDDIIQAQNEKLEALKEHKKGLLQQLFPAEGERVPKLRFSEFGGEWKEDILHNKIELLSGYPFKSKFFTIKNGNKLLTPKNFTSEGFANFNSKNTKFTTESVDIKYICKNGDLMLLLTDLTSTCELLGKPILMKNQDGEALLNQRIVKIIPSSSVSIEFLLFFFLTETFHTRIKDTATGSTVRHSSNKIILNTKILLPNIQEQQKIANCLSSLDELIAAQTKKIAALQDHKKGLMQQLFPNIND